MPKRSLRAHMLARRRAVADDLWSISSRDAQGRLLALEEYVRAGTVALYAPAHGEIDTGLIFADAFRAGKQVLYPAVCGHKMVFRPVSNVEELQSGAFGILEPCPTGPDHQADEADLIVVPGVAFDLSGHRLGYGKGFYDRFLNATAHTAHLVGLCHDFQITEGGLPKDNHDIPMEIVVSERRTIRIGKLQSEK